MRNVFLIRHGATEANEKNLYYGSTDLPLTENGRNELETLVKKGGYPDITDTCVYTSGMRRADETLEALYPGTERRVEKDLGEMSFGNFEMRSYDELKHDPEYQQWITGDYLQNVCPGGESAVQHVERAVKAFNKVMGETTGDVLIVCHGGTITGIMMSLFPDEGENRWYWSCGNGCGYVVRFDDKAPVSYEKLPHENIS